MDQKPLESLEDAANRVEQLRAAILETRATADANRIGCNAVHHVLHAASLLQAATEQLEIAANSQAQWLAGRAEIESPV